MNGSGFPLSLKQVANPPEDKVQELKNSEQAHSKEETKRAAQISLNKRRQV